MAEATASTDRQRLDEWRQEAGGVWHHTVRLVRADRSWRRLHERVRVRSFDEVERVLQRAGYTVLNAFTAYAPASQTRDPGGDSVRPCEHI